MRILKGVFDLSVSLMDLFCSYELNTLKAC